MEEKMIASASTEEIAAFARETLNLEVDGRWNRESLIANLRKSGFEGEAITVKKSDAKGARAVKGAFDLPGPDEVEDYMMEITINATEDFDGTELVQLQHNGSMITVARGEKSILPFKYYECLSHAHKGKAIRGPNANIVDWRLVPQYPFQLHRVFPKLEMAK